MDLYLAAFDVQGSLAHITMLESVGLLTKDELTQLKKALRIFTTTSVPGISNWKKVWKISIHRWN